MVRSLRRFLASGSSSLPTWISAVPTRNRSWRTSPLTKCRIPADARIDFTMARTMGFPVFSTVTYSTYSGWGCGGSGGASGSRQPGGRAVPGQFPHSHGSRARGNEQKSSLRGLYGFCFLTGVCHAGIRNEKNGKTDQQKGGGRRRRGGRASRSSPSQSLREDRCGGEGGRAELRGGPGRGAGGRGAPEGSDHG